MNLLYYLAEANLYLAVFYLAYCLFLNRDTHYRLKRIYLIATCIVSFILPVTQISVLKPALAEQVSAVNYANTPQQAIINASPQEIPVTVPVIAAPVIIEHPQVIQHHFTLQDYLWYAYLTGVVALLLMFFVKLYALFKLMRNKSSVKEGNYKVIYLPETNSAFSFFNYLFIGINANGTNTIIRHELVHIRQKHSADILFVEILKIINWFNPFIYLLQNSLKTVHEYIADEQTAAYETDTLTYSSFLVMNAYGNGGSSITHSFFNYNLLKKRIIMLNQQRSGNLARLKYLVIIPICAALLCTSTLAFSKSYALVDLTPAKLKSANRFATADASHAAKRKLLKITKNGIVTITDQLAVDQKNKKVVYTAANITATDKSLLLKDQHIKVEVVDSTAYTTTDGKPMLPVVNADGYYMMDHFLHKNIHYTSAKGEKGGMVEVRFSLDNDRHINGLKIVKSGGAKLDALALNGFNNYTGIVNDDAGKTLKIDVFFFTGDYSIFPPDTNKNDPEFGGALIITNYKYPEKVTSKGYEYDESGLGMPGTHGAEYAKVLIYGKNGEANWFYNNKCTAADLQMLKNKYGYTFPSGSSTIIQFMHPKDVINNHLAYIYDVASYLNKPYSDQFYDYMINSIQYPADAQKEQKGGTVVLNFNLNNDGTISDIHVAQSAGNNFDEAAVNALQSYKSTIKDNTGKHSIAIVFCVAEKKYRPVVSDKVKQSGYVGELAVSDLKSPFNNGVLTPLAAPVAPKTDGAITVPEYIKPLKEIYISSPSPNKIQLNEITLTRKKPDNYAPGEHPLLIFNGTLYYVSGKLPADEKFQFNATDSIVLVKKNNAKMIKEHNDNYKEDQFFLYGKVSVSILKKGTSSNKS
jgi:TonB family protein